MTASRPAGTVQLLPLPDGQVVEILRLRHPRARRLRLTVTAQGVRLTLPPHASDRLADAFLGEHRDWLAVQLARRPSPPELPPLLPDSCHGLPLRGETLPVHWREGRWPSARLDTDGFRLCLPENGEPHRLRAALRELYLAEARRDLGRWLPRYLPALPRPPRQLRLRPLRSLWGSLSPDSSVSLDLALVLGRPSAFEYVLVHELCHLLHADHSPRFWREVESRWPDWRRERDYLRREGAALKATLRALLP